MAREDLYIPKRRATPIGVEGFVIVLDQYVLLFSLEYAKPSYHYLIGSTLDFQLVSQAQSVFVFESRFLRRIRIVVPL